MPIDPLQRLSPVFGQHISSVPDLHPKTDDSLGRRCHDRLLDGRKLGEGSLKLLQSLCGNRVCPIVGGNQFAISFRWTGFAVTSPPSFCILDSGRPQHRREFVRKNLELPLKS
jgi:hypothetical protein